MKMKKLTALLLATLMVLSLAACGAKGDSKTKTAATRPRRRRPPPPTSP